MTQVIIKGLKDRASPRLIRESLLTTAGGYGPIKEIHANRRSLRGIAFVIFWRQEDARRFVSDLNGSLFLGGALELKITDHDIVSCSGTRPG
ncbi:putative U2 small nuclear ribonucleoprotein B [Giardia muris]|uniref:Putative U2 small nuclear ribonucleoprotein B n=1 Tax=Giardia muris TaxID=5742 RepID=A0A4Z1SNJ7_GIAMU|nr:putative U2 small nuclear ribonucleoprotein B [Giardia muris]|eukprot:TNJ27352.1 putative U2 small nuclear ribonucleoprotein B [Giardia muris]